LVKQIRDLFSLIPLHLWIASSSLICKGIVLLIQLWSIKYFIVNMSVDNYSTYVLISSLSPWILLTDLGIGSALQNKISEKRSLSEDVSIIIYDGLTLSLFVACIFIFLAALSSSSISEFYLKFDPSQSGQHQNYVLFVALIFFIGSSLGMVSQKVWFALHKGWVGNILLASGSIISFTIIKLFGLDSFQNNLLGAVVLFYAPIAISSLFSFWILWIKIDKKLMRAFLTRSIIADLFKNGFSFWIFSIFAALVLQADYLVLSQKSTSEDILLYSVMQKLFSVAIFVYAAVLQALWPRCAELQIARKYNDIKQITIRHLSFGFLGAMLFSGLIYFFSGYVFSLFGVGVTPSAELIMLFGVYNLLRIWTDTFGMLMQSMNILYPLWFLVPLQALITIISQYFLCDYFGLTGIVIGLITGYILTVAPICPVIIYRHLREHA